MEKCREMSRCPEERGTGLKGCPASAWLPRCRREPRVGGAKPWGSTEPSRGIAVSEQNSQNKTTQPNVDEMGRIWLMRNGWAPPWLRLALTCVCSGTINKMSNLTEQLLRKFQLAFLMCLLNFLCLKMRFGFHKEVKHPYCGPLSSCFCP